MHGLMIKAIQCFLQDTYGSEKWDTITQVARLTVTDFDAMQSYDDALARDVLVAASDVLGKTSDVILEDVGTYLVSHPNVEPLRRLLRFGGVSFIDFLMSLDELPDRTRLAVPDLKLPTLELEDLSDGQFLLNISGPPKGFGYVMMGILRAMADDYGALAMLSYEEPRDGQASIAITVHEAAFAQGRAFDWVVRP